MTQSIDKILEKTGPDRIDRDDKAKKQETERIQIMLSFIAHRRERTHTHTHTACMGGLSLEGCLRNWQ